MTRLLTQNDNTSTVLHVDVNTSLHRETSTDRWRRIALIAFACVNAASVGVFFVVFIGMVLFPPFPRDATFVLVVGSFAFAVLVMGQFVHWSRLALRTLRRRGLRS